MILYFFYTDSPSPTEIDSEDEVIFNRILEVNKGNAITVLLIHGLSADVGEATGKVRCLSTVSANIFSVLYICKKPSETGHREHLVWVLLKAYGTSNVFSILKMISGVKAAELHKQLLQL